MQTILLISTVCGIVVMLIGFATIIYRGGRRDQKVDSALEVLAKAQTELQISGRGTLDALTVHASNVAMHVNALLEQRNYEDQKEWRANVQTKLDSLIEGNKNAR